MSIGKRLKDLYEVLKEKKMLKTKVEFCQMFGIEVGNLNKYFSDTVNFSMKPNNYENFLKNNVNIQWVMTGEGDMFSKYYLRKDIGERLKAIRYLKEFSIQSMADMLGVSFTELNDIEDGKIPITIEILIKYKQIFDVDLDYIITGKQDVVIKKDSIPKDIQEVVNLLIEYGTKKFITDIKDKLIKVKDAHQ